MLIRRGHLCLLLFFIIAHSPNLAQAQSSLKGFDMYGSKQVTLAQVKEALGEDLEAYALAADQKDGKAVDSLRTVLEDKVRALGDFAFIRFSRIQYFHEGRPSYITLDLVDAADAAERMTFSPEPTGSVPLPDSVLALWPAFMEEGMRLMNEEEIDGIVRDCPVFHCVFEFEHPTLQAFKVRLDAVAAVFEEDLIRAVQEDRDAEKRATAAFLLGHTKDGDRLVRVLVPAISDADAGVRNNAMRVLSDVAGRHHDIEVPLEPVLKALHYPRTTDRNKAVAILKGLAQRPAYHEQIIEETSAFLLDMLQLKQPNNRNMAHFTFMYLAGGGTLDMAHKDYTYEDWKAWLEERD